MASIENVTEDSPGLSEHREGLSHVRTTEAVMRDYEEAAEEVEAMVTELISAAKKCESLTTDVQNTVRETAEAYRQEGKKIANCIEESALFTANVRKTCEGVKRRMIEGNGEAQ
jgi:hypothetical protein